MNWLDRLWEILLKLLPRVVTIEPHERGVYVIAGRWRHEVGPGLYPVWSWCVDMTYESCAPRVVEYQTQSVTTKDNVAIAIDAALAFRILSPLRALYEVDSYEETLGNALQGEIEQYINRRTWDDCRDTQRMGEDILPRLRAVCKGWGLSIRQIYFTTFVRHRAVRVMGIHTSKQEEV